MSILNITQNNETTQAIRPMPFLNIVLGTPPNGYETDHKDQNKLNNRRRNLRFATRTQNMWNTTAQSNGRSEYKGVYWDDRRDKWGAAICANGQQKYLGLFSSEGEAALAYDKMCKELHGEFACPNKRIVTERLMATMVAIKDSQKA